MEGPFILFDYKNVSFKVGKLYFERLKSENTGEVIKVSKSSLTVNMVGFQIIHMIVVLFGT